MFMEEDTATDVNRYGKYNYILLRRLGAGASWDTVDLEFSTTSYLHSRDAIFYNNTLYFFYGRHSETAWQTYPNAVSCDTLYYREISNLNTTPVVSNSTTIASTSPSASDGFSYFRLVGNGFLENKNKLGFLYIHHFGNIYDVDDSKAKMYLKIMDVP